MRRLAPASVALVAFGAVVPAILAGSDDTRANTFQQTIPVDPAPPLTPAQIDLLKRVTSWSLEFTGRFEHTSAGSGSFGSQSSPTLWSHEREIRRAFHFKTSIAGKSGPSDCGIGNPNKCIAQYTPDGTVEESVDHSHLHDAEIFPACSVNDPNLDLAITVSDSEAPAVSYVPDGTPGKSSFGSILIDYSQNPPLVYSSINFDGSIRHSVVSYDDCHTSSHNEGDNPGDLDAGWSTASGSCCTEGDIQVRVEHGAFVVHGQSNELTTGLECLHPGSQACFDPNNPISAPFTEVSHREWVLRENDCRDTNGNGNPDDDGDGLCDNWETDGLDVDGDGTIDLPLDEPPYNADPEHKDLFVEIDAMDDPLDPNDVERPTDDALSMVKNAFAFAPVKNPDGIRGVRLHFVGSDQFHPDPRKLVDEILPHSARIGFHGDFIDNAVCDPGNISADFDELKSDHFGTAAERGDPNNAANILEAKRRAFRYAIFAHQQVDELDSSGTQCNETSSSGVAEMPGNDLIVTVGSWDFPTPSVYSGGTSKDCFLGEAPAACARRHVQAATFMHELGHTLGLHHGGSDDDNCKPNYLSVMNYAFQFRDVVSTRPLDYSGGVANGLADDPFAPLDERSLSEPAGIAGPVARNSVYWGNGRSAYLTLNQPVDWNLDPNGRIDETGVVADVARLDDIDACARGQSVDVRILTFQQSAGVDPNSIPAPGVFTVHVNGTTAVTPTAPLVVANNRLYMTLPAPAQAGDTFTLDYAKPAVNPIRTTMGVPYASFNALPIGNVTGRLKALYARDDWASLQYDMRLAPDFDDGVTRYVLPAPEPTLEEHEAAAADADFDGDGISNALDDCPAVDDAGQEDLDADGYGDACEPTLAADHEDPSSRGSAVPPANASGWSTMDVTVDVTASDDPSGSGVREIDYVMNGAQSEPQQSVAGDAASPVVTAEGETQVKFFAVDNAGNPELPHTVTVRLDRTAPGIVATQDPPANASGWNNGDVTVSYGCSDAGSGIAACDAPAVITAEGRGLSATGNAADIAGNAAQATVSGIDIDRTAPAVTCSVTPSVLWPPKHRMIPIDATVSVTDTLSGPNGFVLTSVTSSEPDSVNKKDKPGDIAGFGPGTASTAGEFRAERIVKGPGRVYTLTWEGRDAAGNAASCSATVTVPKRKPKR